MSDLIKREDAIKAVSIPCGTCLASDNKDCEKCSVPKLIELINAIPSADRPQGEWLIEKTLYDNYNYRCSYCDWYETHAYPDVEPYNYCPNCGAEMEGVDNEEST